MALTVPTFTIVGHPNKGKSSIVSTLAQTDTIAISQRSGTTEKAQSYAINTPQGDLILVDTPGFQRPGKALKWLQSHAKDASSRAKTVEQFVNTEACKTSFPDEVQILSSIVNGAAIIYVVDGSRPYGPEYELEMEILRWTGSASMALINPIEDGEYIEQWNDALQQYFKSVKVFNPMTAEFEKQTQLFRTFAHLDEKWHDQLMNIHQGMQSKRESQIHKSSKILADLLSNICNFSAQQKVFSETQAKMISGQLKRQFEIDIKQLEHEAFINVLSLYQHHSADVSLDELTLPPDLFDMEQWYIWGLNKKQMIAAFALTGAMGGAAVDALTAGSSFMLGTLGGGAIGAGSALFASKKMADMTVKGVKTGGYTAKYGPITNKRFPYVILGRFLYFHKQVCNLNHANRSKLQLAPPDFQDTIDGLDKLEQKALATVCAKLSKQSMPKDLEKVLSNLMFHSMK